MPCIIIMEVRYKKTVLSSKLHQGYLFFCDLKYFNRSSESIFIRMASSSAVAAVILFAVCAWLLFVKSKAVIPAGMKPLPGPKGKHYLTLAFIERTLTCHLGLPLIDNLLDVPPKHSWLKFKQWADEFGPICWHPPHHLFR